MAEKDYLKHCNINDLCNGTLLAMVINGRILCCRIFSEVVRQGASVLVGNYYSVFLVECMCG